MFNAATTPPRTVTLAIVAGIAVLSLNMFLPSLPSIATDLAVDYRTASLSIAGYLVLTAVLQLVAGPLSDRYGRRPVLLGAFALFAFASVGCTLSTDIATFLFFRFVQGAVIAGLVLSRAIIRDMSEGAAAARRMAEVASIMAIAPMVGPVLGGLLEAGFGWRAAFALYALLGTFAFVLCWYDLGETKSPSPSSFVAQFRAYPELLASRIFVGHAVCLSCGTGAFYAFIVGVPLIAPTAFGASAAMIGVYIGSITFGFVCGTTLSRRLAATASPNSLVLTGRGLAIAGPAIGLVTLAGGIVDPVTFLGATALVGLGNGLTMPSSSIAALSVQVEISGSASGFVGALTVLVGAIVTSITAFLISNNLDPATLLTVMIFLATFSLLGALFGVNARRSAL